MKHRRVITTAESITNFRKAVCGQFLRQCHRYLARPGNGAAAPLRQKIRDPDLVVFSDRLLNILHRHQPFLKRQKVPKSLFCKLERNGPAGKVRSGHHPAQGSFQLTHVGANPLGDEEGNLLRQVHIRHRRLAHQDGHTRFELWRFDRNRQTPAKA